MLRPISGRQVVVRTEACNLCYSNAGAVLGLTAPAAITGTNAGGRNLADMAVIQGHGGVGIVEAVGPEVRRVQVGDRVCVAGTPQCGSCYQCLRGRGDVCQFLSRIGPADLVAIGDLRDGTPVYENSHIGGLAELMVTWEEWVVPVFSKASAADLGMACSCVARCRSGRHRLRHAGRDSALGNGGDCRLWAVRAQRGAGRTHRRRLANHRD